MANSTDTAVDLTNTTTLSVKLDAAIQKASKGLFEEAFDAVDSALAAIQAEAPGPDHAGADEVRRAMSVLLTAVADVGTTVGPERYMGVLRAIADMKIDGGSVIPPGMLQEAESALKARAASVDSPAPVAAIETNPLAEAPSTTVHIVNAMETVEKDLLLPQRGKQHHHHTSTRPDTFEIRRTGESSGMFASRNIRKGERVLAEKPLLCVPSNASDREAVISVLCAFEHDLTVEQRAQLSCLEACDEFLREYAQVVDAIQHPDKVTLPIIGTENPQVVKDIQFLLSRSSGHFKPERTMLGWIRILAIFKTNMLPHKSCKNTFHWIVSPEIGRVNHACSPNTNRTLNEHTGLQTLNALRHIKAGEEITITYLLGGWLTMHERKIFLSRYYNFQCFCSICVGPLDAIQTFDERRKQMRPLLEQVNSYLVDGAKSMTPIYRPPPAMSKASGDLLRLLDQEGNEDPQKASMLIHAGMFAIQRGNFAKGIALEQRAYRIIVTTHGLDNPRSAVMREKVNLMLQRLDISHIPPKTDYPGPGVHSRDLPVNVSEGVRKKPEEVASFAAQNDPTTFEEVNSARATGLEPSKNPTVVEKTCGDG